MRAVGPRYFFLTLVQSARRSFFELSTGEIRTRQELPKFNSREAAVRFVMEELEKHRNARVIVEGAEFGFVDIVQMYAGRKA